MRFVVNRAQRPFYYCIEIKIRRDEVFVCLFILPKVRFGYIWSLVAPQSRRLQHGFYKRRNFFLHTDEGVTIDQQALNIKTPGLCL